MLGYKQALADLGLEFRQEYVTENCITMERGSEGAQQLLALKERPDAIFSASDYPAITAMDTMKRLGIRIPEDIAVVGLANEPIVNFLDPGLTSFDLDNNRIGQEAASMLMRKLNNKTDDIIEPVQKIVFEPKLIVRGSSLRNPL